MKNYNTRFHNKSKKKNLNTNIKARSDFLHLDWSGKTKSCNDKNGKVGSWDGEISKAFHLVLVSKTKTEKDFPFSFLLSPFLFLLLAHLRFGIFFGKRVGEACKDEWIA